MKDKNKCENKYCRNDWEVDYLGKKLCSECWEKKCDKDEM